MVPYKLAQDEHIFCFISHRYSTASWFKTNRFSFLHHIDMIPHKLAQDEHIFCFISHRHIVPHELAQDVTDFLFYITQI